MRKRDVRNWAQRQYRGEVTPFPRWVVAATGALVLAILVLKALGF